MKKVSYVGESFVTSDRVADALLDFTAALGRTKNSEAVEIPIVEADGAVGSLRVVIGPASQLVAAHEPSDFPEPDHTAAVDDLLARTRALGPIHAVVSSDQSQDQGSTRYFDPDGLDSY